MPEIEIKAPICPYCKQMAKLVDSAEVYGGTSYGKIWLCKPCNAYVGVHKNSKRYAPLGQLAGPSLRIWRKRAHEAFDVLWKIKMKRDNCSQKEAREAGYRWLAEQLGLEGTQCHIGKFDSDTCKRILEICHNVGKNK